MIDAAVNASCDAADGVVDGLIQNPAACGFDAYGLVCAAGQATSCLTPAPLAFSITDHLLKYIYALDPNFDFRSFPVSKDGFISAAALKAFDASIQAGNANDPTQFDRFIDAGRKLIMYHGFSDAALTPYSTTNSYKKLAAGSIGYNALEENARLFMVPGMVALPRRPRPEHLRHADRA